MDERTALLFCLAAQPPSRPARQRPGVDGGLSNELMRASEVPSGWTVASMLEHLVGAEEHWCEYVLTGHAEFRTGSVSDPVVLYQAQGQRSDRILATVALDAPPAGTVPPHMTHDITTTRDIILH